MESTFGQELRRLRCAAGLSLRGLARQAHYDPGYLSKVENGVKRLTSELASVCDRAMGTGGVLTGLVSARIVPGTSAHPQPDPQWGTDMRLAEDVIEQVIRPIDAASSITLDLGIDDISRRECLRLLNMAGTLVAMAPAESDLDWERMDYATGRSGSLDLVTVDEYAALNAHLWRVFTTSRHKNVVFHLVRQHLDVLISSLHRASGPVMHRRLCVLTGDLFQLAGEIFFDGNRYTDAAHCYTVSAAASKEAGAFDLWACSMTRHAFINVYERQFDKAASMLELAVDLAHRGDGTLSTRHWASAVHARALAGLGELDACQRALDLAEQVHRLNGQIHNGGWLRFDETRLAEERGACYIELRRPHLAAAALTDALNQGPSLRRRGIVLTDLAMSGVQQNDSDLMIMYANAALDVMRQTRSSVVGRKLRDLQTHLKSLLGDSHVRHLNEQITTLTKGTVS